MSLIKPLFRVLFEDATNMTFTQHMRARDVEEIKEKAKEYEWRVVAANQVTISFSERVSDFKNLFSGTINIKDLVAFYKQLANMFKNNVPLMDALAICRGSSDSKPMKAVLGDVITDLQRGVDLASAMSKYPNCFDRITCTAVKAANAGGYLDEALIDLAASAEMQHDINRKVNGASIYPAVVSFIGLCAMMMFGYKVMPQFIPMYKSAKIALPMPTKVMMAVSDFLTHHPLAIFPILAGPVIVFIYKRQIFSKPFFQTLFLRIPIVKKLIHAYYMARYLRMMAQLTDANIPFSVQMNMLKESSPVPAYKAVWVQVRKDLDRGVSLTSALGKHEALLGSFVIGNLRAGEKAGQIAETADYIAGFYEGELQEGIKNMSAIMEPFLIVLIGGMVAFLMLAMFLPIFDLARLNK